MNWQWGVGSLANLTIAFIWGFDNSIWLEYYWDWGEHDWVASGKRQMEWKWTGNFGFGSISLFQVYVPSSLLTNFAEELWTFLLLHKIFCKSFSILFWVCASIHMNLPGAQVNCEFCSQIVQESLFSNHIPERNLLLFVFWFFKTATWRGVHQFVPRRMMALELLILQCTWSKTNI